MKSEFPIQRFYVVKLSLLSWYLPSLGREGPSKVLCKSHGQLSSPRSHLETCELLVAEGREGTLPSSILQQHLRLSTLDTVYLP